MPAPGERAGAGRLDALVATKEIVIVCGSGGVGKTSTAAATAAMAAARHGGRVLVLTVDPARRLADALGLAQLGNQAAQVPPAAFRSAGPRPRGELWAAMLDTKSSWDDLVRRHAPDRATAEAILANPLYRNVSGSFVQSHDYIAMERLYEIHEDGDYDLVVVDTPPTANALDFLDAPQRMGEFFSSRLLRWLLAPYRSRLVSTASRPFYLVADRILGSAFLEDVAEFFLLFQSMYDGFVERSRAVRRVLADPRTTFLVVSTLEPSPLREAEHLIGALRQRRYHLGAVVLNKVLPSYLRDEAGTVVAEHLRDAADEVAAGLPSDVGPVPLRARVLLEIAESFLNYQVVARREGKQEDDLAAPAETVIEAPYFEEDVVDLAGVLRLGESIW